MGAFSLIVVINLLNSVNMVETEKTKTPEVAGDTNDMKEDRSLKMSLSCKSIRSKFGNVMQMQTHELFNLMEGNDNHVVVLDVRPPEEFDVSHIRGSLRVDPGTKDLESVLLSIRSSVQGKPGTSVVAYCSLGYRSSEMINKLDQYVKTTSTNYSLPSDLQMFNLEGSLFKWANENRPMVDLKGDVTKVCHPYNVIWGKFLRKELRAIVSYL